MFIPGSVIVALVVVWLLFSRSSASDRRAERDFQRNEERDRMARVQSMTPEERQASSASYEKMKREVDPAYWNSPEGKARAARGGNIMFAVAVAVLVLWALLGSPGCPRH